MRRYLGGQQVLPGIYCSLSSGELLQRSIQDPVLPGDVDTRYIRLPAPIVLVVGPLMGLAFVVFLPLVGIVVPLAFAAQWITRLLSRAARKIARDSRLRVSGLIHGHWSKAFGQPGALDATRRQIERR